MTRASYFGTAKVNAQVILKSICVNLKKQPTKFLWTSQHGEQSVPMLHKRRKLPKKRKKTSLFTKMTCNNYHLDIFLITHSKFTQLCRGFLLTNAITRCKATLMTKYYQVKLSTRDYATYFYWKSLLQLIPLFFIVVSIITGQLMQLNFDSILNVTDRKIDCVKFVPNCNLNTTICGCVTLLLCLASISSG